jgi:hypothetical protein
MYKLQVRAPRSQRVQAALSAPGQEGAQVGFGVLAGGALETGQVGSHCQPQLISERLGTTAGGDRGKLGEVHHAPTMLPSHTATKVTKAMQGAADVRVLGTRRSCIVMQPVDRLSGR